MSRNWHEMAGYLQRGWLGADPGLTERLEKASGGLPETEAILSAYARDHAAAIAEAETQAREYLAALRAARENAE